MSLTTPLSVQKLQTALVCKLPEEKFDFLGYTFGRCYSPKTGRAYLGTVPSKKRVIRICEAISEMTGREQTLLDQELVVAKLNRTIIGWANYFYLGPVRHSLSGGGATRSQEAASVVVCQPQTGVAGGQTVSGGISA